MSPHIHPHLSGDPVRAFVETIVIEAGFSDLPPEAKAECVAALMAAAQARVGTALMEALDRSSLQYFDRLMERGASDDELAAFFHVRIPKYEQAVEAALTDFGEECLATARQLGGGA